jgi:hypothetical protein
VTSEDDVTDVVLLGVLDDHAGRAADLDGGLDFDAVLLGDGSRVVQFGRGVIPGALEPGFRGGGKPVDPTPPPIEGLMTVSTAILAPG